MIEDERIFERSELVLDKKAERFFSNSIYANTCIDLTLGPSKIMSLVKGSLPPFCGRVK